MLDPSMELLPPLSSPTISSISSSDLDTESTGSFFHDRSITLGTLMGVATTFRLPSRRENAPSVILRSTSNNTNSVAGFNDRRRRRRNNNNNDSTSIDLVSERRRKRLRRRKWWWLCSGDDLKPSSLGEYLEVERRFGEEALFGGETVMNMQVNDHTEGTGTGTGTLFADGRVLPPQQTQSQTQLHSSASDEGTGTSSVCNFFRFSVSLAGICSGGAG
ncbi:hypothetical protein QVD17_17459 [Tagetes erecta]|uniref:Uncharacterized protein n=1 Tax=Tagetes erecta TaxID=13708 RepID=A0AAD8KZI8_TARER|nr:hypothetical protein QVD17_17459 [Tagetes erecta]